MGSSPVPKISNKEGWKRLKRYLLRSGPAMARAASTKLDDQPNHQGRFDGWRFSCLVSLIVTGICLLLNIIFLTYVSLRYPAADWIGAIPIQGGCSAVKSWDSRLHIVLNVLGTALLGASNYNMQCLTSPTRLDVDAAHKKGKWLEIGIPSTRNLRFIARRRVILWWCLFLSTLPLHVLWNSAIFSTLQWNDYSVLVVSDNFLDDDKVLEDFKCTSANVQQYQTSDDEQKFVVCDMFSAARNQSKALKRMEPIDCMKAYSNALENTASDVLAVTAPRSLQTPSGYFPASGNTSSILAYFNANSFPAQLGQWCEGLCNSWCQGNDCPTWCLDNQWNSSAVPQSCKEWAVNGTSYNTDNGQASDWICDPDHTLLSGCSAGAALTNRTNWTILPEHYQIDYCLSLSVPATCKLQYSFIILLVVIICNVVKLIAIALTLVSVRGPIFATVGDCVASFLTDPDQTTVGQCLVGKEDLDLGSEQLSDEGPTEEMTRDQNGLAVGEPKPLKWEEDAARTKRWYQGPTATRWAGCFCL